MLNFKGSPSLDEILAEYPALSVDGITEIVKIIDQAIDAGVVSLDDEEAGVTIVSAFGSAIEILESLPPEVLTAGAVEIIEAAKFAGDLAAAAAADGRSVTPRAIALSIGRVGLMFTQRDAKAGDAAAKAAVSEATRLGLL